MLLPLLPRCFCCRNRRSLVLTIFWAVLFFLALGIRVVLHDTGELVCTILLVAGTTFAFTCWKGPRVSNDTASNSGIIGGDSSCSGSKGGERRDGDAIELQQPSLRHDPIHGRNATVASILASAEEDPTTDAVPNEIIATTTTTTTTAGRLPFLDNVKTFLTALVVTHHAACAFGGCGGGGWYLIVGKGGPPAFQRFLGTLTLLDQSYFMPLFFFVSAYFLPSSYERAGGRWKDFARSKRKRLLVPALVETFAISPLAIVLGGHPVYLPAPSVAWFLFWLMLFQVVYASFQCPRDDSEDAGLVDDEPLIEGLVENEIEGSPGDDDAGEEAATIAAMASPTGPTVVSSTCLRMACGVGICGLSLLPFLALQLGTFASMPIFTGSLTCDFFMFYLGLQANKNGWFEKPLIEQLDIHPLVLAFGVVLEGAAMTVMVTLAEMTKAKEWWLPVIAVAGMFCLDMSLLVLVVFHRYLNFETKLTRFLARGAYGVYLTHPLVLTGTTLLYVAIGGSGNEEDEGSSSNGYYYPVGFVFVNLVGHAINWPLAYFLAQLPYLKAIL